MKLKIRNVQIQEIVVSRKNDINKLDEDITKEQIRKQSYSNEILETKVKVKEVEESIKDNEIKLNNTENILQKYEKDFDEYEVRRIKVKECINEYNSKIEILSNEKIKKDEQRHKLDIVKAKYEIEKESLYSGLKEKYDIEYEDAIQYKIDDLDFNKLKININGIKNSINSLGVVNVGAIQEFEEIKEKYTFMNSQKEDLCNAKEELKNVINEMTQKIREVFSQNFKIIAQYFNQTFNELFKGGSADLILENDDELNGNIIINVQPPGKKLQNINLMSGGEKVLSAIALLFAILKMKPTPFCILDEIEAALDDANVFRYAEFLKKFSDNIQFIVITHRKGTMQSSDVLYGVTMEEKGISKIVSLNLSK
jgi:chromosome segregation protein